MLENLDRLKAFYFVYKSGSVGDAAKMLHVTQPAVSQAVQKLESEIDTALFIRQHKKLTPTSAGNRLYSVVEPFIHDLDICLKDLAMGQDQPFGEIRLGAPAEFGKAYLPAIMASFRQQYPNVSFHLKVTSPETLIDQVGEGKLDLALVDLFLINPSHAANTALFSFEPVANEKILLACSHKYREDNISEPLSLDMLSKLDFIEYSSQNHTIDNWFKHHYKTSRVSFRTAMTVDNHETVIAAIKQHTGLGIVVSHLVQDDIKSGEITPISPTKEDIINQISLVQLQDKIPTLTEKVFKRHLLTEIEKLGL